jgi:hypothetical protein
MAKRDQPILPGPCTLVYHPANKLPGDLPNEIIFKHPETRACAVYVLQKITRPPNPEN